MQRKRNLKPDEEQLRRRRATAAAQAEARVLKPEDVDAALSGSPESIQKLQEALGNQAVGKLLQPNSNLPRAWGKKAVTVEGRIHLSDQLTAEEARDVMGHELAHVAQQTQPKGVSLSPEALEAEAQRAGQALSREQVVPVVGRAPAGMAQGFSEAGAESAVEMPAEATASAAALSDLAQPLKDALIDAPQIARQLSQDSEAEAEVVPLAESLAAISDPLLALLDNTQVEELLTLWQSVKEAEALFVAEDVAARQSLIEMLVAFLETLAALAEEMVGDELQPRVEALYAAIEVLAGLGGLETPEEEGYVQRR